MYGIEREREREKIKKYIRVKKNKIKKLRAGPGFVSRRPSCTLISFETAAGWTRYWLA
jgi:hypothetical protein